MVGTGTSMKFSRILLVPALLVLVIVAIPMASASTNVGGAASSCSQLASCYFVLNNSAGTGFASTSVFGSVTFRLPGELNTSHGSYTAKVVSTNGTTDRVQGTLLATDANSGKIVLGSTDTNITVTQHCSRTGCGYTYKMVKGTIQLHLTNLDATATTVSCSPSTFSAGGSTRCTATVTDLANHSLVPRGNVTFSTYSGAGTVGTWSHSTCTLVSGKCSVRFTAGDETVGSFEIFGNYHGLHRYYASQGTAYISVTGN
jgi:hypothetical protein